MMVVDPFISNLNQLIENLMCRSMRSFIGYARESAISISRFVVLFQLGNYRAIGVADLGDCRGLSSAAVSRSLERIVLKGLILRSKDPIDQRVMQLS